MYYNINKHIIYTNLPNNAYNNNKSLIQNLELTDIHTKADCGYYTIRNDSPSQPPQTIEDISARIVSLDKPYVDIIRTWIPIIE